MINFIKQAVESVEGIKSFLFNTDYRNNFDLQNVKFPCCVLTPIMKTNYDLNNIIRDSAEIQMSVVESAPYDYTGDDLYEINKRCSDLALQVIANLQVKTKFDKELTFEFILPSGDELVSGVMCNLQCTMKQGSCIGAPSYIEIVVQAIKRESITSNGKYLITPSSGFNAMREVEVDVNVDIPTTEEKSVTITSNGEVEILPTSADAMTKVVANVQVPPPLLEEKQVTITKAKTTEIITPGAEYGLSRVEVSTDIPLESKQVTITENGTTTIEASEGFEGMSSVEVTTNVNTLQGLDFDGVFDQGQGNEINQYYKDGIEYAKQISQEWVANINRTTLFNENKKLVFFPDVDLSQLTEWDYDTGVRYSNVEYLPKVIDLNNALTLAGGFSEAFLLKSDVEVYANNATTADYIFTDCIGVAKIKLHIKRCKTIIAGFYYCQNLKHLEIEDVSNITNFAQIIQNASKIVTLFLGEWKQSSISIVQQSIISPESIHYIIQNAVDLAEGATQRTLTLHATAKTNWQNSECYEQDLAVLEQKGITIA